MPSFSTPHPLFLASNSPRRKQILESLGLQFQVLLFEVQEDHPSETTYRELIVANAERKAEEGVRRAGNPNAVIIAADTLVVLGEKVLGKPKSRDDARQMLENQSGKTQQVFTGLVLRSEKFGIQKVLVESKVKFRCLSHSEIEGYISTIEPYDKAGAYAVQGIGGSFIENIEGSYTNVMGLPVEKFLQLLELLTHTPLHRWIPPQLP